jgi:ribosomal protein S15P/S13E
MEFKSNVNKIELDSKKIELDSKLIIGKLEIENKLLHEQVSNLKTEIVELKSHLYDDNKDFKEMAKNASIQVVTNNTMNMASESALRYITKNFPNAPVLERKDIPKLIEYDNSKEPEKDGGGVDMCGKNRITRTSHWQNHY